MLGAQEWKHLRGNRKKKVQSRFIAKMVQNGKRFHFSGKIDGGVENVGKWIGI